MSQHPAWRFDGDDLLLSLKIQPRASKTAWAGPLGNVIKLRLAAVPVAGKANAALLAWLAEEFGVAAHRISLEQGSTGRLKLVRIRAPARFPDFIAQT